MATRLLLHSAAIFAAVVCVCVSAAGEVGPDGLWSLDGEALGSGEMALPEVGHNITAAYFAGDPDRRPISVGFNEDATQVRLHAPAGSGGKLTLEVAEKTTQFPDGRIVFSALDATVEGVKAKLESHPGNHRIGFWTEIGDSVHWDYKATRPGMYDVELCYSLAGGGASKVEIELGGETAQAELSPTGSWYRYSTAPAGRIYIAKAGKLGVGVCGLSKTGGALMNLKAVTLRPAPEGDPVVQAADGVVELDASSATVHSTLMQYERNPKKLCLGYWANPKDWASWSVPIARPGTFRVELTQGCGAGHGGSEVAVVIAGQSFDFVVDDTGGFQNWKVRELGEVKLEREGDYVLEVRPRNKTGVAVMDIRRIRLVPAGR